MGFKDARERIIAALRANRVTREGRVDLFEKNWLQAGRISSEQVVELLLGCRGHQHNSSPHHVMKLWKEGDRTEGICSVCDDARWFRYERRGYELSMPRIVVEDVLQGVCEVCGEGALIPPQSLARVQTAIAGRKKVVNMRIPRVAEDLLITLGGGGTTRGWSSAAEAGRGVFGVLTNDPHMLRAAMAMEQTPFVGPAAAELSLRVPTAYVEALDRATARAGAPLSRTELFLRGLAGIAETEFETEPA